MGAAGPRGRAREQGRWYNGRVALSSDAKPNPPEPQGFAARQGWKRTLAEIGVVVALLVGLFFVARSAIGCVAEQAALALPTSVDSEIGEAAAAEVRAEHSGAEGTTEQQARVERVFGELKSKLTADESKVLSKAHVTALRDETVNAFALPGGEVFVLSGLLDRVGPGPDGDAQLRGVMAHELGHAVRRHGVRLIARNVAFSIALSAVFGSGGDKIGGALVAGATQLESLHNSRDMETEADDFAVDLLHRAGYDPEGLARFLEDLGSQPVPQLLSTHPDPAARAKRIRARR